ncbi:MAG: isoquinoline 1-oxidoreductase subunit beta [Actinomycetota bacterium]|nr:isoquinoline 1-oxidoreductase subunit beta [Actinomycetota bacterium]
MARGDRALGKHRLTRSEHAGPALEPEGDSSPDPAEAPHTAYGFSRRRFLAYAVAAPVLTVVVTAVDDIVGPRSRPAAASPGVSGVFDLSDALTLAALPTAYLLKIVVTADDRVIVHVPRAEVGQGITTAMAIVAAEELDARFASVDAVLDDARPELLWNQLTGGSNSVHSLYTPMRTVAAATRARLVTAAAQRFGVAASTLTTRDSTVVAPDGRTATYGSLSAAAAKVTVPTVPGTPKDPAQFTRIGQPTTRIDAHDIVTGKAKYALDLPIAAAPTVVARAPTIGGTVLAVDDSAARGMPGVLGIARIPSGVAVAARTFDRAQAARDALRITWNPGPNGNLSDTQIRAKLKAAAPPFVVPPLGSISVSREFDFAFAPHAPLEVLTCVADVRRDSAEIWYGAKSPIVAAQQIAAVVGLPPDKVTLHVVRSGGSFGHRLFFDPAIEAAQVSKALGRPVKLMWTRNDDMRHGRMRPASHHKVRATYLLGKVLTYEHRHATLPVDFSHGLGEALSAAGFDGLSPGVTQTVFALTQNVPYNFGVATQTLTDVPFAFPTGSWRSIYSGQTATVNEIMVDEIARTLNTDPVSFRRRSLSSARTRAVLDQVTTAGRWGRAMPPGTAQGVAIHEEYKSVVAYLVEIDCRDRTAPRVTKGVCAVDVGRAVNPRGLEAQMQGVLTDGLSMALHAGLHIDNGAVREGSYSDYRFARMADSPVDISVIVMPPTGDPGGAGELGFPAAAAAVANAYARATGTTPFSFPILG